MMLCSPKDSLSAQMFLSHCWQPKASARIDPVFSSEKENTKTKVSALIIRYRRRF